MLHEILFALIGHTGSIFIEQEKATIGLSNIDEMAEPQECESAPKFIVNPSLGFISQAEIEQLNNIILLGALFKQIQTFLDRNSGINSKLAFQLAFSEAKPANRNDVISDGDQDSGAANSDDQNDDEVQLVGVYVKAFCSGVEDLLKAYKEHLLTIEHEYLRDRSLTIQSLQLKLQLYFQLFPELTSLINQIIDEGLQGGLLLSELHKRSMTGNPVIKSMITRILFECHKVFYHQVNAWIVHGQLIDLCEEFFIHKMEGSGAKTPINKANDDTASVMNKTQVSYLTNLNALSSILAFTNADADQDEEKEDEWSTNYTLRHSMLPSAYISAELAQKILFIGKAVKVLQSNKTPLQERIPLDELKAFSQAIIKLQNLPEFNSILFGKVIEEIRECVASRLWHLIVIKADLLADLSAAKNFFLLAKGEFYQTFIDESRSLMQLPPQSTAEYDLNEGPRMQTILKLALEDDKSLKRFKFVLRSFSFSYSNFSSLNGLVCAGDVDLSKNNFAFKITSSRNHIKSGALWHSLKQKIEMGFQTTFGFRFRNNLFHAVGAGHSQLGQSVLSQSMIQDNRHSDTFNQLNRPSVFGAPKNASNDKSVSACLTFVIQTEREIAPWKKTVPLATNDINSYVAVKFVTRILGNMPQTQQRQFNYLRSQHLQTQSLIQIWGSVETQLGKIKNIIDGGQTASKIETLLAEVDVSGKADFMDGFLQQVMIDLSAAQDEILVYLIEHGSAHQPEPIIRIPLKVTEYVKLDSGAAYIGFCQETQNLSNVCLIENWSFESSIKSNQKDAWGGLSLDYKCSWPQHLMLSADVMEKYNSLFRFLFPIKRVQMELQFIWSQKVRSMKHLNDEPVFKLALQLRQHMSFLIDNLYSYLQVDVMEGQWVKLADKIRKSRDFEEVRMLHDGYLDSVKEQCFLNLPKVLKALQDVLQMCSMLCRLLREMDTEEMQSDTFREQFWQVKSKFERQSSQVYQLLLNFKNSYQSAPFLSQLLLRIDYNGYFTELSEMVQQRANQEELHRAHHQF